MWLPVTVAGATVGGAGRNFWVCLGAGSRIGVQSRPAARRKEKFGARSHFIAAARGRTVTLIEESAVGGVCLLLFIVERIFLGAPPDPLSHTSEVAPFD